MKFTITLLLLYISIASWSQRPDIKWYFGEYAAVDFTTTPPSALTNSQMLTADNSSTYSDCSGQLQLYSNGVNIWDKNHSIMPNGTSIGGNISGGQAVLIVPQPNSSFFYVFTCGGFGGDAFRYTIVDISLNGGNGTVTSKGNILFNNSTEKIDAIFNPLDTSYWVMTHTWNSNQYYCYKIKSTGLVLTPVISTIGSSHSGGSPSGYNAVGQMTFSPDGSRLASAVYSDGFVEIFDFNMSTGQLSNVKKLIGLQNSWGLAFSLNNNLLYYTEWYGTSVYQFNLSMGTAAAIQASKISVGTATFPDPSSGYKIGYLQNGPDNKIYVGKTYQKYMAAINNPNTLGIGCGFSDQSIFLANKLCGAGLSRTVNKFWTQSTKESFEDTLCKGESFSFNKHIIVNWYKDSLFTTLLYSDSTFNILNIQKDTIIYYKSSSNPCNSLSGKIVLKIIGDAFSIELGNDTLLCSGTSFLLKGLSPPATCLWQNQSTDSTFLVTQAGKYYIKVNLFGCIKSDTISISYIQNPTKSLLLEKEICVGEKVEIVKNNTFNYLWSNGATSSTVTLSDSGLYWVKVFNQCDTIVDSVFVKIKDCTCNIFIPNAYTPNNDGINETFYPVINCDLDEYHFYIFNRWGMLLFESTDQNEQWDGKYENKEVPDGVYFFLLEYKSKYISDKKEELTGSVTIIR